MLSWSEVVHFIVLAGTVSVRHVFGELRVWGVHNFGMQRAEVLEAMPMIRDDSLRAEADPWSCFVLVLGGFNINGMDVTVECVDLAAQEEHRGPRPHQSAWGRMVTRLMSLRLRSDRRDWVDG